MTRPPINTISARAAFREALAHAMEQYEQEAGPVETLPIVPGRESCLWPRKAEFDAGRAVRLREQAARAAVRHDNPDYLRNLRAYQTKRDEA